MEVARDVIRCEVNGEKRKKNIKNEYTDPFTIPWWRRYTLMKNVTPLGGQAVGRNGLGSCSNRIRAASSKTTSASVGSLTRGSSSRF